MASFFFYGTLLHPAILTRVTGNDGSHLKICSAILKNYSRHKVAFADFPAITPAKGATEGGSPAYVQGSLVIGLTESDIKRLDRFEGNMYRPEKVEVHPTSELYELASPHIQLALSTETQTLPEVLNEAQEAVTYVWALDEGDLLPEVWSYPDFVKQKLHRWL